MGERRPGQEIIVDVPGTCYDRGQKLPLYPSIWFISTLFHGQEPCSRVMQDCLFRGLTITQITKDYTTQHTQVPSPSEDPYSDYERLHDAAYQSPSIAETEPFKEKSDDIHVKPRFLQRGSTGRDESYRAMIASAP